MKESKVLEVYMHGEHVGTLAETREHLVAFEYSDEWIRNGFSLNPLSLPLRKGVFIPRKYDTFDGLFGVFADSLPDGWGRLLVDRFMLENSINPAAVEPLGRLAIVGSSGMGALEYRPSNEFREAVSRISLDKMAAECAKIFESKKSEYLDELFRLGGSSGGARPKINYEMDGEEWIVKFPSSIDRQEIGREEYEYSLCARKCGILMSDTKLIPSDLCGGYFATKRFDRESNQKVHMISVSALLETSHRIPNLDYNILMQLTLKITQSYEELEKLFRLMCFNVFSHNRDDHSKNFSYLYKDGTWELSPAYDLTYSNSIGGEHATAINGNGKNPNIKDVLAVAKNANMNEKKACMIAEEIESIVYQDLSYWIRRN